MSADVCRFCGRDRVASHATDCPYFRRFTPHSRGQFGTFDGLDNRKALMRLLDRLGDGLSHEDGCKRRAKFLQGLLGDSTTGFDGKPLKASPCTTVEAYHLTVAITGCLGVPIEVAAQKLDRIVSQR